MKWNCVGVVPRLQALLKKDHGTVMEGPRGVCSEYNDQTVLLIVH